MTDFAITREDTPTGGRYVVRMSDKPEAEMTFTLDGPTHADGSRVMVVRHTLAPREMTEMSEMSGMGVGKALVENMVKDVRARGVKIMPLCSFTRAMLEKRPDGQDVLDDPF